MAADPLFTGEEMVVDKGFGYPIAYSKLCRDRSLSPYSLGPPFTFIPYALQQKEDLRARVLEEMFPILDPKAKPTGKTKIFVSLLWKQLNHLGNAGFDPAMFRVDPYGNVLYFRAESASPLAWDIDHWFPCSRGGLTVPSNLRILQWQVCNKKHHKLEFLIPWWDLQLGISVNQFLSIFASSNSDFRHRAFSLLFLEGESEELNDSQAVDSHTFPQHFIQSKEKLGLAPAAIVLSQIQKEAYEASSALKSLDINIGGARPSSSIIAVRKSRTSTSKENENPDMLTNLYQAKREESAKIQSEIQKIDDEVNELKQKTEDERVSIQELELVLIKRRRRAEKCRRLAEAQASYKAMLEKMIRDTMHQSVIYKEQLRLNRAAADALMARLEAQKAICESSETELHRKFRQRDELEKQIRPEGDLGRKRSRMGDSVIEEDNDKAVLYLPGNKPRTHFLKENCDNSVLERGDNKTALYLPGVESNQSRAHLRKELRVFLAEEQKASKRRLSLNEQGKGEQIEETGIELAKNICKWNPEKSIVVAEGEKPTKDNLQTLVIGEEREIYNIQFPVPREPEKEEDEESRKQRGKGNVEKWLQILLENSQEDTDPNPQNVTDNEISWTDEMSRKVNLESHPQEINFLGLQESEDTECLSEVVDLMKQGHREKNSQQTTVRKADGAKTKEEKVEIEESTTIKNPPYKLRTEKKQSN